jgi:(R,R)-butanediol dehydrogenase/meso-butanediol dehydrogenase/diacetyl reductase
MKSAVFHAAGEPLVIERRPDPDPGPGEVVMKVHSCGICGSDLHMTQGHAPAFDYPSGTIPGHEYAGEVVAVGADVTGVRIGDRISALPFTGCGHCPACQKGNPSHCPEFRGLGSGFSEYVAVSERTSIKLPPSLSYDDGALLEPLAVGLHGAAMAGIRPGSTVLVMGAGPIGLAATFFARKLGAGRIVVLANSTRREDLALQMGADAFIVQSEAQPLETALRAAFGALPDVVLECAGQPGCIGQAIQAVRKSGTVVVLGFCTSSDSFVPATAVWKEINLRFSNTYTVDDFRYVAQVLARGSLEPRAMITRHISLDDVPSVFEELRTPSGHCKVMIHPWA